jgi:UDP-N-acetylmuramate dehydrogenase
VGETTWPEPQANVPLAPLCTLGVGGPARWYAEATSVEDVASAARWAAECGHEMLVLGGGSNLVIADEGVNALVLRMAIRGVEWTPSDAGCRVTAGAGEPWDDLVASAVAGGWSGIECLSGIPGRVGGTPIQNVGAYGQEVADTIENVTAFDRSLGHVVTVPAAECGFAYRTSRFKTGDRARFVICAVTFGLRQTPTVVTYPDLVAALDAAGVTTPTLADVREAVLRVRRRKGMVVDPADTDTRSVGSFFTNPVVAVSVRDRVGQIAGQSVPAYAQADGRVKIPAAWLIERAGFARGARDGRAGISHKHPLALVNAGGASARDILRLAVRIKRTVRDRFGVSLAAEPVCVGFGRDEDVDFLRKADN